MDYEGQICRSPMERGSFMLPVSVGCAYNKCRFCMLFKHLTYRVLPLDQVEGELRRVKQAGGDPRRVFLGDGSAFVLPTGRLLEILALIHRYFPSCDTVNMDATVPSVLSKSDGELAELARAGVRHLYLGIESGLDDVLAQMDKDHNTAQALEAAARLQAAGLIFDAHIMTGVAGAGRGQEDARALAQVFRRARPARIVNFSLFLHREAPLYRMIEAGEFRPASELENLEQARTLVDLLDGPVEYDGFHDAVSLRVRGELPRQRQKMLRQLDAAIASQRGQPPLFAVV